MTEYVVVYERAEDGGWGAYLPDVPGVVALGQSEDEVASGLREALTAYAEEMRSLGRDLPPAVALTGTVAA
jgi:predicted RNase H-like HicB family nuclease